MRKRQLWTGIGASIGMLVLILDGRTALEGAQKGVELCIRTVIPSLFPFFLLSILLTGTFMGEKLPLFRFFGKLFRIPEGAESILIPAFLGGYPVGGQCIAEACRSGQLDKDSGERMLAFCNNAGPSFLFGMVACLFPRKWMVWVLWGSQILSAFLVANLFPCVNTKAFMRHGKSLSVSSAMTSAIKVMASVCGWVVLFRVVIAFLSRWVLWILPTAAQVAMTGLLELSNGCCELNVISDIPLRFVLCAGMLSLGGVCVTMQTVSVTSGLSLKYYFPGKLIQTVFSVIFAMAIAYDFWFPVLLVPAVFLFKLRKRKKAVAFPGFLVYNAGNTSGGIPYAVSEENRTFLRLLPPRGTAGGRTCAVLQKGYAQCRR